ncbi:hypothetical protein B0H14DRAFT_3871342 [Mycena olivaceomarginata]|nr:hypothetical protein B0H14DRAFT_3871342 [Mycena olivaceomarginata]
MLRQIRFHPQGPQLATLALSPLKPSNHKPVQTNALLYFFVLCLAPVLSPPSTVIKASKFSLPHQAIPPPPSRLHTFAPPRIARFFLRIKWPPGFPYLNRGEGSHDDYSRFTVRYRWSPGIPYPHCAHSLRPRTLAASLRTLYCGHSIQQNLMYLSRGGAVNEYNE